MFARFRIIEPATDELVRLSEVGAKVAAGLASEPAVAAAKAWQGFPFRTDGDELPEFKLSAVSALGADRAALARCWEAATEPFRAATRYEVEGEVVRATGTGWGCTIPVDDVEPLDHDEPVLVVITGDLYPEHMEAFLEAGRPAVAQAQADPGYLGGCGLTSTMLDITSFSCWRSAREARRYAFANGAHRAAKDADEAGGWHDMATSLYLTLRVLDASGSLLGYSPFSSTAPS